MKATISWTTLAVASMLVSLGGIQAEELNYSEFEARLAKIEAQLATQNGLQQAAYCDDCGCGTSGCCESSCCDSCCGGCGGCGDCCGGCGDCCGGCGCGGGVYAQVDMMFLRAHIVEDGFSTPPAESKLAEEYELSPRFIVGIENSCGLGARLRYWHYGHHLDFVDNNPAVPGGLRTEIDVFDAEVTNRLCFCRTDVLLGAGFRLADLDFTWAGVTDGVDMFGGTIAADIETLLCCRCNSYWSVVYGGRLSLLGGDWDFGSLGPGFNSRDDNIVAHEIYGGVEYGCCYRGMDIYTQLKVEIQNWHSDVLSQFYTTDSVGFVGPGFAVGVGY